MTRILLNTGDGHGVVSATESPNTVLRRLKIAGANDSPAIEVTSALDGQQVIIGVRAFISADYV